jgi:hypothetical protein
MKLWKAAFFFLAFFALPTLALAQSGHPEITVSGSQGAAMKGQITAQMFDRGFTIVSDNPSLIVFEKVSDNLGAMFLFGTAASGPPHIRVSFSIAEYGGNTRIVADLAAISNAGTAFERRNDLNFGQDAAEAQSLLSTAAARAAPPLPTATVPAHATDDLTQRSLDELVAQKRAEAQAAEDARNKAVPASTGPTPRPDR